MPMAIKEEIYTTALKSVMTYGSEWWILKKKNERKLKTTEIGCDIRGQAKKSENQEGDNNNN